MEGKPIGLEPASVRQTDPTRSCFRGGLYALALVSHLGDRYPIEPMEYHRRFYTMTWAWDDAYAAFSRVE